MIQFEKKAVDYYNDDKRLIMGADDEIRAAVAKLRHEQYNAQLDHPEEGYVPNRRLASKRHQIYGIEVWITLLTNLSSR